MLNKERMEELLEAYKVNNSYLFDIEEFREDVLRFMYVSRILRKYDNKGDLNVNLIINHLIILHNCFGTKATEVLIEYVDHNLHAYLFGALYIISRLDRKLMPYTDRNIINLIQETLENKKYDS